MKLRDFDKDYIIQCFCSCLDVSFGEDIELPQHLR